MQFGDEGKGKVTDFLAEKADLVVRYSGGNNAGHTVMTRGKKYKFHLIPSGAIRGKKCCIAAGVALDPRVLVSEIENIEKERAIKLVIDPRAHLVMPYHNQLDTAEEKGAGKNKIGTTGRGIGPCYADRAARIGFRFEELLNEKVFREKLAQVLPLKKKILENVYSVTLDAGVEDICKEYLALAEKLRGYCGDVSAEVNNAIKAGKTVLFEGAQGTFLDNDFGTYPFVTSSHPITGSIFTGVGIGASNAELGKVIGIAKAYTTRVGEGFFPTEVEGKPAEILRKRGSEFGTTTARPRRIGWLDIPMLKTSARLNGITEIALTKLDVLEVVDKIKVCVSYSCNGKTLKELPANTFDFQQCKPNYIEFDGFSAKAGMTKFEQLSESAQKYINFIEKETGLPIKFISIGPNREDTILR